MVLEKSKDYLRVKKQILDLEIKSGSCSVSIKSREKIMINCFKLIINTQKKKKF